MPNTVGAIYHQKSPEKFIIFNDRLQTKHLAGLYESVMCECVVKRMVWKWFDGYILGEHIFLLRGFDKNVLRNFVFGNGIPNLYHWD